MPLSLIRDKAIVVGMFIGVAAFYVAMCGPTVVPYRDAGEMTVLAHTLGVAHPPGYPLYTVVGKIFSLVPVGNAAYRTNLMSAVMAAGAVVLLFWMLRHWIGILPAILGSLFFCFSNPFLELACVSEMYTMGMLMLVLLLFILACLENIPLLAFVMGLSFGVRMDYLLLAPVFAAWIWWNRKPVAWGPAIVCFVLGLSIFLYLPVRSLTDPWIDWGNPETLGALFRSVSRRSYASTLDLVALSYRKGENFLVNIGLFVRHLIGAFGWAGAALAVAGGISFWRKSRSLMILFATVFLLMGPVFLFMANMPPNPHAIAIVEASYPPLDLMVSVQIAFGAASFIGWASRGHRVVPVALLLVMVGFNAVGAARTGSKRNNFHVRDYVGNVWKSLPFHSVAVFHKDVPLFSLWESQLVAERRPDVSLISSGLSGSPWYWEMKNRWPTASCPSISVRSDEGWRTLRADVRSRFLAAGYETAVSPAIASEAHGLVQNVSPAARSPGFPLDSMGVFRGARRYGDTPDFFSSDLLGDTARAFDREGMLAYEQGRQDRARRFLRNAISFHPKMPNPYVNLGFILYQDGNFLAAERHQEAAVRKYEALLEEARRYKSLPEAVGEVKRNFAEALVYLGVTREKLGKIESARAAYRDSIARHPTARAHYNSAVTYWNKDWGRVVAHLEQAVALDPSMVEAAKYLTIAKGKIRG